MEPGFVPGGADAPTSPVRTRFPLPGRSGHRRRHLDRAPSTSPVIPPNRRTQCATSAAPHASATSTASGPCHRRGSASTASAATATTHDQHHRGRLGARRAPTQRAALRGGHRAPARRHRGHPARGHRDDHRDDAQLRERQRLQQDRHHHGGDAERARPNRRASPAAPAPAARSSRARRRCRTARRCAGRGSRAAGPPPRARRPADCPRRRPTTTPTPPRPPAPRARRPRQAMR